MKRTRYILLWAAIAILAATVVLVRPASAQVNVFTVPQGFQGVVMNAVAAGAAVTPSGPGSAQCPVATGNSCAIKNLGQNVHFLTYTTTGSINNLIIRLEGSIDGVNFFPISADATNTTSGAVCAVGYYPVLRAFLFATAGVGPTVTAQYSGTSGTSGCPLGTFNPAQDRTKIAFGFESLTSGGTHSVSTPFANSYGTLFVASSGCGGSCVVTVTAKSPTSNQGGTVISQNILTFTVPGGAYTNTFPLPAYPTSTITVSIPGATINTFSAAIVFAPPPIDQGYNFTNIITNANTEIKNTGGGAGGIFASITINSIGSSDWAAIAFDGTLGGGVCTGTRIGGLNVGSAVGTVAYLVQFKVGLCITTQGTTPGDLTVAWR